MLRTASAGVLLMMLCATAVPGGQAQGPTPVFRSRVDLVEVDAYVTDSAGRPVTDLTADDFEVVEGGKRQTIAYFSRVNIPIERAEESSSSVAIVEPDVQSNDTNDGRLYIIAVDDLTPANGLRMRAFLRQFVEQRFGPNDLAAVVLTGRGRRVDTQELTSNRRLLLRAIDRISGWPNDGPELEPPITLGSSTSPIFRMYALRDLMQSLERIPSRRKAVLLFTEEIGINMTSVIDAPLSASVGEAGIIGDIARDVLRSAARANVTIYPIDPHGLTLINVVNGQTASGMSLDQDRARRRAEVTRRQDLYSLGEETGGFALVSSNSYEEAFERIVRENSTYYLVGILPDQREV